jgi:hypothetical protein
MKSLADKYITSDGVSKPPILNPDHTFKKIADKYILQDGTKPKPVEAAPEQRPTLNLQQLKLKLVANALGKIVTEAEVLEITLVDLT